MVAPQAGRPVDELADDVGAGSRVGQVYSADRAVRRSSVQKRSGVAPRGSLFTATVAAPIVGAAASPYGVHPGRGVAEPAEVSSRVSAEAKAAKKATWASRLRVPVPAQGGRLGRAAGPLTMPKSAGLRHLRRGLDQTVLVGRQAAKAASAPDAGGSGELAGGVHCPAFTAGAREFILQREVALEGRAPSLCGHLETRARRQLRGTEAVGSAPPVAGGAR